MVGQAALLAGTQNLLLQAPSESPMSLMTSAWPNADSNIVVRVSTLSSIGKGGLKAGRIERIQHKRLQIIGSGDGLNNLLGLARAATQLHEGGRIGLSGQRKWMRVGPATRHSSNRASEQPGRVHIRMGARLGGGGPLHSFVLGTAGG
eukprot:5301612-Alexandrium_andersonii.AAC.1